MMARLGRRPGALGLILVMLMVPAAFVASRSEVAGKIRQVGVRRAIAKGWDRVRRYGVLATLKGETGAPIDAERRVAFTLSYSLADSSPSVASERADQRESLPEIVEIPGGEPIALADSRDTLERYLTWHRSGGNEKSTKFSALAQVNTGNVHRLQPAWSFVSGSDLGDPSKTGGLTVETNPIVVGDRMYVTTIDGDLVSLDAATGKELWRRILPPPVARRGLVWEPNARFDQSRLFVPTGKGVVAVSAATGTVIKSFGNGGSVGSSTTLIAPVIIGNQLIIATIAPALEAYDLRTGKQLWVRSLLAAEGSADGQLSGASPWGGMSADLRRQLVFVATGNPRPALIGTSRPGDNAHSSSIVAIDARDGRIRWSFQEVKHDLWDMDIPTAPVLTTISRAGQRVDVVVALTKRGNALVLDRESGRTIFGHRLKRTPVSRIPGERTSPYQPVFELPEPFADPLFTADKITDVSESATRTVSRKLRGATYGFFEPPRIGGKIALYGIHGGAEWPGGAVDPRKGILFVPSNQLPWVIRTQYADTKATPTSGADIQGDSLYQANCASCHGAARRGRFEWEGAGDAYLPALTGITFIRDRAALESVSNFRTNHEDTPARATAADLQRLYQYFRELDVQADANRTFALNAFWQLVLDDRGNPGSKPPWGLLTAIDLSSGKRLWQVPFGELKGGRSDGSSVRGLQNMGGVVATAGGLLFATGTTDNRVRAYAASDGKELWSYQLPAAGSTFPTVYSVNGTQYVVVVATGGAFKGFSGRADRIIAFKLPSAPAQ